MFDTVVIDEDGNALNAVEATVNDAGTANLSTIYNARSGGGTKTNPITTTSNGLVQFWAAPGSYDITFHDTLARIADRTFTYEAVSGATAGIAWSQIDNATVNNIADANVSASAAIQGSKLDTLDGRLKQTTGIISPNADFSVSYAVTGDSGWTDLSGTSTSIVPDVSAYLIGYLVAKAEVSPYSGNVACGGDVTVQLSVDGSRVGTAAEAYFTGWSDSSIAESFIATISQVYRIPLTSGSHPVKLQARGTSSNGATLKVYSSQTNFSWQLVAQ